MFFQSKLSLKEDIQFNQCQPRLQQSFTQTINHSFDHSLTNSVDTQIFDGQQQIKQILAYITIQQKKKYLTRKTDNTYIKKSLKRMKKSQFINYKIQQIQNILIPKQINRVITFTKKTSNLVQIKDQFQNAILGSFFGYVIGDTIGANIALQTQNIKRLIPTALLMNGGGTFNLASGQGTDETQIMLSTAYGLLQCEKVYNQNVMGNSYLKWLDSKPFDLPVLMSLAFSQVRIQKMRSNQLNKEKIGQLLIRGSRKNQKHQTNLGLIRILPCTIWGLNFSQQDFEQFIQDQIKLICPNPLVLQTSIVYAKILRLIILKRDHQLAFYETSKWVYQNGSQQLLIIWEYIEKNIQISNKNNNNNGKLRTSFCYAMIQCHKKNIDFKESLMYILSKGGDCDSNCAIVLALIGAIVGFNQIPNFFTNKIINANIEKSLRPRSQQYCSSNILAIARQLIKSRPQKYVKSH